MATIQPQEFHLFPELPLELRRAIWNECLPHVRIVEINKPYKGGYIYNGSMSKNDGIEECTHQMTYKLNSIPPVIAAVCRESRQVAGFPVPRDEKWQAKTVANRELVDLWFDHSPGRNVIFLDWDSGCGHYWSARPPMGPFKYLSLVANYAQTVCVTGEILHTLFPPLSDQENFRTLWSIETFLVCQKIIAIHAKINAATQSGLWGFNGEERIVLVPVGNRKQIEDYANFDSIFGSKEYGETKDFFQRLDGDPTQGSMQQELLTTWKARFLLGRWHDQQAELGLQKVEDWNVTPVPGLFGVVDSGLENWKLKEQSEWANMTLPSVPRIQWVYMFRLCVNDCYVKRSDNLR
ncbi:hypothetical protein CABS01_05772 [Colletotrichum abscissum]|uniref:uncharacterized protein n=1 Tax=Colletotrichum abscissum TaxID=1671311 RepID=UPI0027D52AC0|nr:uncharacterized protein CABS01_05772 [Colletotrichum abscissum]KAK1521267.1 hypothetical protein CABS01_05772 [Colletotrichum abscissum]